jgi:hypothetical protein
MNSPMDLQGLLRTSSLRPPAFLQEELTQAPRRENFLHLSSCASVSYRLVVVVIDDAGLAGLEFVAHLVRGQADDLLIPFKADLAETVAILAVESVQPGDLLKLLVQPARLAVPGFENRFVIERNGSG